MPDTRQKAVCRALYLRRLTALSTLALSRQHPLEPATVAAIAAPSTDSDLGDGAVSERAASDGFQLVDDHAMLAEPRGDAEWVEVVPEPEYEVRDCKSGPRAAHHTWLLIANPTYPAS